MIPYVLLCCFIIAFGAFFYRKQQPNVTTFIFFVVLALFSGLRGEFTADHSAYSRYFEFVDESFGFFEIFNPRYEFSMEKEFVIFSRFIGCFTDSSIVYTLVISTITVGLIFRFYKTYSKIPWITILLFVSLGHYFSTFNLIRQSLAVAVTLNAIPFLCKGKWKSYIAVILIAAMIHRTALIMLPMGFILTRRVTKGSLLCYFVATVSAWLMLPSIILFVQSTIPRYSSTTFGLGSGTINAAVPTMGIALFALYSINLGDCHYDINDIQNRVQMNGLLFHLITLVLGVRVYNVTRFAEYFEPYVLVAIANLIADYNNEREQVIVTAAICALAIVFAYITLSGTGYDPYYTIFS